MNPEFQMFSPQWMMTTDTPDPFSNLVDFSSMYDNFLFAEPFIPQIDLQGELPAKGAEPVVQTFYEGPDKCDCCINWIEKKPAQMPESERGRYNEAAICLYRCKDHENEAARVGGLASLRCNRVVIQSQLLIDLIRPTLEAAGSFVPEKGDLDFTYPFKDLYFSYTKLMELSGRYEHSSQEGRLLGLLEETIRSMFGDLSTKATQFRSKGTTDYECLWTLFPKGMVVYLKHLRKEKLLRVTSTERVLREECTGGKGTEKKHKVELGLRVRCEYIGFDGTNFGSIKESFYVEKFEEECKVTSLKVYPLGYHLDKTLWQRCIEQGKKLFSVQSVTHCAYEGSACRIVGEGEFEHVLVTGRVIVDPYRFNKTCTEEAEVVLPLEDDSLSNSQQGRQSSWSPTLERNTPGASITKLPWLDWDLDERPSEEQQHLNRRYFAERPHLLVLIDPCVIGYSLSRNAWFELHLNKLRDISWTPDPLETLIFDSNTKQMLAAFSKQHFVPADKSDGPLASKGQGLVVLLSGPSGTGKTLTAEVVAEENKLPLYRVMAGQLGSTPTYIEHKLEQILGHALAWNAVILLDEADTFIRSRQGNDRVACEIVSIFLRRLEYFAGIMFLTTNMPDDIDEALRSRCRLHIPYKKLTSDVRYEVWKLNFVKVGLEATSDSPVVPQTSRPGSGNARRSEGRIVSLKLDEDDMQRLVLWELSGREIHNVVQNVALWCKMDGIDVNYDRVRTAMQLTVPYAGNGAIESNMEEEAVGRSGKRPRLTVAGASKYLGGS